MINLLIGPPGGGKSYEAVAFHLIPAIEQGRKVITNLPLEMEAILELYPEADKLIELRTQTKADYDPKGKLNRSAFANALDYSDPWRHPHTGAGPLYIIDECHIPLPVQGTVIEVEIWYSLHRHESADVLLMTQSYGKINKAIRDLVQILYRVRKATAFGSQKSYIRKVQDGIRGDVVNEAIRRYKPEYFKLYKSHTRGGGAELAANDIIPFWKRWPVLGFAASVIVLIIMLSTMDFGNPLKPKIKKAQANENSTLQADKVFTKISPNRDTGIQADQIRPQQLEAKQPKIIEPLEGKGIHIVGHVYGIINGQQRDAWRLAISQNGQLAFNMTKDELEAVGYNFIALSDCVALVSFQGKQRTVICDAPTQQVTIGGGGKST